MANHMAEVAKILGVELNEKFRIEGVRTDYIYKISDRGLVLQPTWRSWWEAVPLTLTRLLTGEAGKIIKLPWKPKYGELYYAPHFTPYMCHCQILNWGQDKKFDNFLFSHGLVFKTEEEAVAMTKKFLMMAKEEQKNG